jgi:hypothetical protein
MIHVCVFVWSLWHKFLFDFYWHLGIYMILHWMNILFHLSKIEEMVFFGFFGLKTLLEFFQCAFWNLILVPILIYLHIQHTCMHMLIMLLSMSHKMDISLFKVFTWGVPITLSWIMIKNPCIFMFEMQGFQILHLRCPNSLIWVNWVITREIKLVFSYLK